MMHLVNWREWQGKWKTTIVKPVAQRDARASLDAAENGQFRGEEFQQSGDARKAKLIAGNWVRHRARRGIMLVHFNEHPCRRQRGMTRRAHSVCSSETAA